MPTFGSSRRARFETSKLVGQTIIFLGAALILLVVFFFVILPQVVKFIAGNTKITNVVTPDSGLTIQPPIVAAPVNATFSAQITLTGYTQKENQVVILDNAEEIQRVNPQSDGSFSTNINLKDGPNQIAAYNVTPDNKQSASTSSFLVLYEKNPPTLVISEPTDGQSVQGKKNQNLTIKGTAQKNARVTVNDRLIFSRSDGTFTTLYLLSIGQNTLDFKETDEAGNLTEKKITVTYAD